MDAQSLLHALWPFWHLKFRIKGFLNFSELKSKVFRFDGVVWGNRLVKSVDHNLPKPSGMNLAFPLLFRGNFLACISERNFNIPAKAGTDICDNFRDTLQNVHRMCSTKEKSQQR